MKRHFNLLSLWYFIIFNIYVNGSPFLIEPDKLYKKLYFNKFYFCCKFYLLSLVFSVYN